MGIQEDGPVDGANYDPARSPATKLTGVRFSAEYHVHRRIVESVVTPFIWNDGIAPQVCTQVASLVSAIPYGKGRDDRSDRPCPIPTHREVDVVDDSSFRRAGPMRVGGNQSINSRF